jgi:hypothetical protein
MNANLLQPLALLPIARIRQLAEHSRCLLFGRKAARIRRRIESHEKSVMKGTMFFGPVQLEWACSRCF